MRELIRQLLRPLRQLVRLDDAVARPAGTEARMLEEREVEADEGRRALDPELGERSQHPRDGALAIHVVDDQLRDHRVVEPAHLVSRLHARVDADARPRRLAIRGDPPRRREEALRDVLRVDAALDCVAAEDDVLLRERKRLSCGDQDLLAHEVEPRHRLGDRVLDLDAGVHLHEEIVALAREQTLDRPGRAVARRTGGVDRDPPDPGPELVVDGRRRGLLDELLVPTLDRAVPLAEMDHVPVRVGEDLHLDVPRILEVPLDVDGGIGEVLLTLSGRGLERALGVARPTDELHPLAATPGRGLDDERVADLGAELGDLLRGTDRVDGPGNDRHARVAHHLAGGSLRPHQLDRRGRGADPRQPRLLHHPREGRVLGEEPVPGVDRLRAAAERGLDEHVPTEVALRGRTGPDEVRLVGRPDVRAPPVGLRVDGHTADPELAQRPEDADRDLAAIGHEHLRERRHAARILPEP